MSHTLKVLFCGARKLGIQCLRALNRVPSIQIMGAVVPPSTEDVWWTDVDDSVEVAGMGLRRESWESAWAAGKTYDLVFSVLTPHIFRRPHLDRSRLGIINLHPAPLPQYRGCNSYSHALLNGESWYAVSLHYVDEGIDTGPIIGQAPLRIFGTDTARTLYNRAQQTAFWLFRHWLPRVLMAASRGTTVTAWPQGALGISPHYYGRSSLEDKRVDLTWPKGRIKRKVRALQFDPFPPAYAVVEGKRIPLQYEGGKVCLM